MRLADVDRLGVDHWHFTERMWPREPLIEPLISVALDSVRIVDPLAGVRLAVPIDKTVLLLRPDHYRLVVRVGDDVHVLGIGHHNPRNHHSARPHVLNNQVSVTEVAPKTDELVLLRLEIGPLPHMEDITLKFRISFYGEPTLHHKSSVGVHHLSDVSKDPPHCFKELPLPSVYLT